MLAETLRTLFGYNGWAMERVLDSAAELTPDQLATPAGPGLRSVLDTLLHCITVQRNWVSFCDGSLFAEGAARQPLDAVDFPDVASVRAAWEEVEAMTRRFVDGLSEEEAARVFSGKNPDGTEWSIPLRKVMLHVIVHSVQHRSEAAAMLTGFGHSPGDLDLLFYS